MGREQDQPYRHSSEPLEPSPLPAELAEFLRDTEIACLMQGTDQGTAFVIKLPAREIDSARGTVLIQLRHELYAHPAAPVIRTILVIYDQLETPLAFDTFTNIGSSESAVGALPTIQHQKAQKSSSRFWLESNAKCRRNLAF